MIFRLPSISHFLFLYSSHKFACKLLAFVTGPLLLLLVNRLVGSKGRLGLKHRLHGLNSNLDSDLAAMIELCKIARVKIKAQKEFTFDQIHTRRVLSLFIFFSDYFVVYVLSSKFQEQQESSSFI